MGEHYLNPGNFIGGTSPSTHPSSDPWSDGAYIDALSFCDTRHMCSRAFPYWAHVLKGIGATAAVLASTGCANIPNADLTYFSAQTTVSFKVVRTVACNAKDMPFVANTVTPSAHHSAQLDDPHSVPLAKLRGSFSNSDFKIELTEDGRLAGINATSTGLGEAVLKAVSTLSSTLVAFNAALPTTYPTECAFIKEVGGGKPISITYEGSVDPALEGQGQSILPDASGKPYVDRIKAAIGEVCAVVVSVARPRPPAQYRATGDELLLRVKQPGWAHLAVRAGPADACRLEPALWKGRLAVAQLGVPYDLPIPKPAPFGKQVFAATFADSGALKSLQYASDAGQAQAAGGLNSLLTLAQGETTSQKLASVKAEADLIVQQQRLVACLADPTSCK